MSSSLDSDPRKLRFKVSSAMTAGAERPLDHANEFGCLLYQVERHRL
jgi:hypothetical protein